MLAGLAQKWRWRKRREDAGEDTDRPNLVFGGDVHVVWEKLCRYFDIEPRIVPLEPDKYVIGPDDVEPHIDERTIGVVAVLGTTFTGHADDVVGMDKLLQRINGEKGWDVPLHVDAASGGFVWPFLYPEVAWDFRLETVRSINVSGHKFGMVYPGHRVAGLPLERRSPGGHRLLRELPGQEGRDVHAELLDGELDGPRAVLQLLPLRPGGVRTDHRRHAAQRRLPEHADRGERPLRGRRRGPGPAAARLLPGRRGSRLRRVRRLRTAGRRARLDGSGLRDAAERRVGRR